MLSLMIGGAVAAAPISLDYHHAAVVRTAFIDDKRNRPTPRQSEQPSGGKDQMHAEPSCRTVVLRDAASRRYTDAFDPRRVHVQGLERLTASEASDGRHLLPVRRLDVTNGQFEASRVLAPIDDLNHEKPVDIGRERPWPIHSLGHRLDDAAREEHPVERACIVQEALRHGHGARNGSDATAYCDDSSKNRHRAWTITQTVLGAIITVSSIIVDVCLIVLLVVLFEFIRHPEERIWPVGIARIAVAANIVIILSFLAFVTI